MTKEQYEDFAKRANAGENIWSDEEVSDCCTAPIIMGDLCSACKEHCEASEEDCVDGDAGYDQYKEERAGLLDV